MSPFAASTVMRKSRPCGRETDDIRIMAHGDLRVHRVAWCHHCRERGEFHGHGSVSVSPHLPHPAMPRCSRDGPWMSAFLENVDVEAYQDACGTAHEKAEWWALDAAHGIPRSCSRVC